VRCSALQWGPVYSFGNRTPSALLPSVPALVCVLQCVTMCCSVLQCVAASSFSIAPRLHCWHPCPPLYMCCRALHGVAVHCNVVMWQLDLKCVAIRTHFYTCVAVCDNVVWCVIVCCSAFQCVLQCVAVRATVCCNACCRTHCSVLQCFAVFTCAGVQCVAVPKVVQ